MRGSVHVIAFIRFEGQRVSYKSTGLSKVDDIDTSYQINNLLGDAVNNAASRVWARQYADHDSGSEFSYESEVVYSKIISYDNGKRKITRMKKRETQENVNKIVDERKPIAERSQSKKAQEQELYGKQSRSKKMVKDKDKGVGSQKKRQYSVAYYRKIKKQKKS